MKTILCTLVLLFLGQDVFSFPFDLSVHSEGEETVLLSEEAEEIATGSEVDFSAGLQKNLYRTRVIADLSFFFGTFLATKITIIKPRQISHILSTAKILYPFHSFP